jgi:hypothetical protein
MEVHLLSPHSFEDTRTLGSHGLEYAVISIQEILVHTQHLKLLREKEFKKYEKLFSEDGKKYRDEYFPLNEDGK